MASSSKLALPPTELEAGDRRYAGPGTGTMMGWKLPWGVGFCRVDDELVFADLTRDKYLVLRGDDRAAFERLQSGDLNGNDAITRLAATGLIAPCKAENAIEATTIAVPGCDLAGAQAGFSWPMACSAAAALWRAHRAIKLQRVASALARRAHRRSAACASSDEKLSFVAAGYAACRWAIPVEPRCLIDALALDDILLRRGLAATLVFGVRLNPFAAHCWLQTTRLLLTGTAAEARNFTPIMVIG
jgi:hypothetical protein